ncbi:alpha/beta fold hydrolase [Planktotalea arctica]|uniref:alpha/beta fold hydrolase n=1 Tax=Planktotalea arctica TaxID=1481893 RepID=UPI00321B9A53
MPRFETSDGLSLFYQDAGTGLPLLCLSGLTRDSRDFEYVLPYLKGCRVIRLDYRGRGQSDWAEDFSTYNIMREAQDAVELLDHLGLEKAAILGTSRGGLIAMGLAATLKARLIGVALNDIGPELDPKGLEVIMGYLGVKPKARTLEEAASARAHVMRDLFPNVPQARWMEEAAKFFVQTDAGLNLTYDPKLRDAVEASSHAAVPDLWPWFEALSGLPCAIIRGANSDLLTQDCFDEMLERLPDASGAVIPDRAHVPFLDEPEAVALLQAWIGEMQ